MNKLLILTTFSLITFSLITFSLPAVSLPAVSLPAVSLPAVSLQTFTVSKYSFPIELSQNKTCELCENIVEAIAKDSIHFNATITDIIEFIKKVCENVKGPSGMECLFILNNIEEIMNWILSGLSPIIICELLDFCNSTNILM
tara:strand:- start:687 stop:1115 length:429 start_codon:yes stop_codon:yes gene_type:complete